MRSEKSYSQLTGIWALVFFFVAMLFLFVPDLVVVSLNGLAELLGLSGTVTAPASTLWHVLALSLMGTLTVLAVTASKHPTEKTYYTTIVSAKMISVVGFTLLAIQFGSAWLICAVADGFVALTLALTFPKAGSDMTPGFARTPNGRAPHYEVWYGKVDLSPGSAFWFRYTITNGKREEASTWAILFENEKIRTGKETWNTDKLAPANSLIIPDHPDTDRFEERKQVFHLGKNHLDEANAIGQAGDLSWDLSFIDHEKRFEHVPASVKALGVAKSTYYDCFMDLSISGQIRTGSRTIELKDRPGMIGHIYGKQSAHEWAWAHCNNFEGKEHVVFEGISARIKVGGKESPPLTSTILFVGEEKYAFSSFKILLGTDSEFGDGKWKFEARSKHATLSGKAIAPSKVALVEYTDTDDSNLWCYNSKMADLELQLTDHRNGTVRNFVAKGTAAFELVDRNRPDRDVDL